MGLHIRQLDKAASSLKLIEEIIMGRVHNALMCLDRKYRIYHAERVEKLKIKEPERQKILSRIELTAEQTRQIDELYESTLGRKIPYDWHRLYTAYTGQFDAKYIPELLFIPRIQEKFVPRDCISALSDKNMLPLLVNGIKNVKTPQIFLSCINGHFRTRESHLITKNEAICYISDLGECFIKPTIDSNSGRGCRVLNIQKGVDIETGDTVDEILKHYGSNFNIQELIVNGDSIRKLHPESVNTIRITSYIWNDKVQFFPLLIRIGRGNNKLDNAHQGGIFVGVSDSGKLKRVAFTEFMETFEKHPDTNISFGEYMIPEVPEILEAVRRLHERIPQVGMISWDVTTDSNNNAVIVEMNLDGQAIWLTQMANGEGAFGENTKEILKWIRK